MFKTNICENKMKIALKIKAKNGYLQAFIDEMGWNQAEFSRQLGICPNRVGLWFNMRSYPKGEEMADVCAFVGKSPQELFPEVLKDKGFLGMNKHVTYYQEIDTSSLLYNSIKALSSPEDDMEKEEKKEKKKEALNNMINTLPDRKRKIIIMRFGLDGEGERTLATIGKELGINTERVRQICACAIRNLQHPVRSRKLESFL